MDPQQFPQPDQQPNQPLQPTESLEQPQSFGQQPQAPTQPFGQPPMVDASSQTTGQPQFVQQPSSFAQTPAPGQLPPAGPISQPGASPQGYNPSPISGGGFSKGMKLGAIIAGAVILLVGGGAAAYFGMIVPNKPENILKRAVTNTIKEESATTKFSLEFSGQDSASGKIEGTVRANSATKATGIELKGTVMGMSLSGEARYVDKSAYVKVGDLSNISELVKAYASSDSAAVTSVMDSISDKWYEIDSTLLDQAKVSCMLDADIKLSESDYTLIENAYKSNQFIEIKDHASEEVDGKAANKFNLVLDPKKSEPFAKSLNELSVIKKLNECNPEAKQMGEESIDQEIKSQAENAKPISFSVWVDKATKRFTRVAAESKEDAGSVKVDMRMDYSPVTIDKPTDAKPIMTLMTDIAPLLGDFSGSEGAFLGIKDIISE